MAVDLSNPGLIRKYDGLVRRHRVGTFNLLLSYAIGIPLCLIAFFSIGIAGSIVIGGTEGGADAILFAVVAFVGAALSIERLVLWSKRGDDRATELRQFRQANQDILPKGQNHDK